MLNEDVAGPSGARLTGDDLQHAIAWYYALRTLVPLSGVASVTVEAADAGNVDDVVVKYLHAPPEYIQVKASVTARQPVSMKWLTAPSSTGGPSILQRFFAAAQDLQEGGEHPQLTLITNRSIDSEDPLLTLRDRNDCLEQRVRAATGKAAVARNDLRQHLSCTDEELYTFLRHFRLHTDASEKTWRERIMDISLAAGLRADITAFRIGVAEVREWVKTDRRPRGAQEVAAAAEKLALRTGEPAAVVAIKALDDAEIVLPDNADVLEWVPYFRGTEARNRRGLKAPANWNDLLWPELLALRARLRSRGAHRVLVTGTMRLPTWFVAGVVFQESVGFVPAKRKEGSLWTKPQRAVAPAFLELSQPVDGLPKGQDVALALAIAADLTPDVEAYMANQNMDIPLLAVCPPGGPSNASIDDAEHAYAMALRVRDIARQINRVLRPPTLHLFIATPAAFALMLGGLWDRVPNTQTYEDLSGDGYEPAYLIPN